MIQDFPAIDFMELEKIGLRLGSAAGPPSG